MPAVLCCQPLEGFLEELCQRDIDRIYAGTMVIIETPAGASSHWREEASSVKGRW